MAREAKASKYQQILLSENNKRMCKTTLTLFYLSNTYENGIEHISKTLVLSLVDEGYNTDSLFSQAADSIQGFRKKLSPRSAESMCFDMVLEVEVPNADNDSLPGVGFSREFISCAAGVQLRVVINLNAISSGEHHVHSAACCYISSDNGLDVEKISGIAGVQPSIVYRKGEQGRYTIAKHNAWVLKTHDDSLPEKPIASLMKEVNNPQSLGQYCREEGLHTHIDVTCYGIPSEPVSFQINSRFFHFCRDMDVEYADIDMMV